MKFYRETVEEGQEFWPPKKGLEMMGKPQWEFHDDHWEAVITWIDRSFAPRDQADAQRR